jgi:hypothetical protein
MIRCTNCNYGWNPDTATTCVQCKKALSSAGLPPRSGTMDELPANPEVMRNPTLAESGPNASGQAVGQAVVPNVSQVAAAKPWSAPEASSATGGNAASNEARRRTVLAESSISGEVRSGGAGVAPVATSSANAGHTPIPSGTRRPQTIAIDPSRKIVGVLITYSWQESGQVFPVLEGRNLIGKDPDQCDICIPQDATLSAVNSFITYRKQFLIGDKVSMSGTDVDGEPIESEFIPLRNYAKIRTGSTYWTFVCIQPPAAAESD